MKKAGEGVISDHKTVTLKTVQETETQEGHLAKIILPFISNIKFTNCSKLRLKTPTPTSQNRPPKHLFFLLSI